MTDTIASKDNPQPYHTPTGALMTRPPVGIDIGGTKINAALVIPGAKPDEEQIHSLINAPTPRDADEFLHTLVGMVGKLKEQTPVSAVGIATAGVVDSTHGRILGSTANVPALQSLVELKARLEEKVQLPVHVENDANAAAYGEYRCGAARGSRNMFAITLGTGVGMGLVFNGRMYRGSHFFAGEGGHIAIAHTQERRCTCTRWDCWEAYASGTGMKTTAEQFVAAAPEAERNHFMEKYAFEDGVTTHAVIAAWRDGNALGQRILDEWHQHIAVGLGSLVNVLDPDMVVVGGGMAQFVNFEQLTKLSEIRAMSGRVSLVPAQLGNYAGIVGAAYLALETLSE